MLYVFIFYSKERNCSHPSTGSLQTGPDRGGTGEEIDCHHRGVPAHQWLEGTHSSSPHASVFFLVLAGFKTSLLFILLSWRRHCSVSVSWTARPCCPCLCGQESSRRWSAAPSLESTWVYCFTSWSKHKHYLHNNTTKGKRCVHNTLFIAKFS